MKTFFLFRLNSLLLCFALIFLSSCSKESIVEPEVNSVLSETDLSGLTSYTSYSSGCSSSVIPPYLPIYSDYIYVGNGKQAKTLKTSVYNTDTHIFIEAHYIATIDQENLPGKVTIEIGGTLFEFNDVNPGETVEANVPIPTDWFSTYVAVNVTQKVFLEPAEVHVSYFIAEPCPIEVGAELMGGLVGYVLQPGDPGYVEGETHGLIISSEDIGNSGSMNWYDAMSAAESLELNGFDDWTLPTGNEALTLLQSLPGELSYDPVFDYGYWTSVEVSETTALSAVIIPSWSPGGTPTIETSESLKSSPNQVRVVRRF